MPKPLKDCYIHFPLPLSTKLNRDPKKIGDWIRTLGGVPQQKEADDRTTHCVLEEKYWKGQPLKVKAVLEANEDREPANKIIIVGVEWLDSVLSGGKMIKVGPYRLDKPEETCGRKSKKDGDGSKEPKGPKGLMAEVLEQATTKFADPVEKRRLEADMEFAEMRKREFEHSEKLLKQKKRSEATAERRKEAALVKSGAKKGAAEIFSMNHHIYEDHTGFSYDVTLTKVNTRRNSNERQTITIYESNASPHTYATNLHCASTYKPRPENNILAAVGANFLTAFRMFRRCFKEKTGLDWDDRVIGHNARILERQRARQDGDRVLAEAQVTELFFRYMPPAYGARGIMKGVIDEVPETVKAAGQRHGDGVEDWVKNTDDAVVKRQRWSSDVEQDAAADGGQDQAEHSAAAGTEGAAADNVLGEIDTDAAFAPHDNLDIDTLMNDPAAGGEFGNVGYPFPFDQPMETGGAPSELQPTFNNQESTDPEADLVKMFGDIEAEKVVAQASLVPAAHADATDGNAFSGMPGPTHQGSVNGQSDGFVELFDAESAVWAGMPEASEPVQQHYTDNRVPISVANTVDQIAHSYNGGTTGLFEQISADTVASQEVPEQTQESVAGYGVFGDVPQTTGQETADAATFLADFHGFANVNGEPTPAFNETQPMGFGKDYDRGLDGISMPRMSELPEDLRQYGAGASMAESLDFLNGTSTHLKQEEQMSDGINGMAMEGAAESGMPSLGKRKREDGDAGDEDVTA